MDSPQSQGGRITATASGEPRPNSGMSENRGTADSPSRRPNDESWVQIASQPSSSSLSSIADDEIITTGLRVRGLSHPPRRRQHASRQALHHHHSMPQSYVVSHAAANGATSSQDEYDETESEEDVSPMSRPAGPMPQSLNPHLGSRQQTAVRHESSGYDDDGDDGDGDGDSGDESATALGPLSTSPVFRPQPNAFSHPPSHLTHRHSTPAAYPSANASNPYARISGPRSRRSSYSRGGSGRTAPNFMSPPSREDNDAALRASLTTLLSCAAAARGLPNRRRADPDAIGGGPTTNAAALQPSDLRLVPEAELMAEVPGSQSRLGPNAVPETKASAGGVTAPLPVSTASKRAAPTDITRPPSSSTSPPARGEKSKRAAAGSPSSAGQKAARATKKKRTEASSSASATAETFISPTLLTWVVSAGVVVLVSVVGFGAGYVIGREVGRQEGASGFMAGAGGSPPGPSVNATGSCGREVIGQSATGGTLRRFRWGSMGRSVAA